MAANNGPYQVYPGQAFVGSKVSEAKQIFGKKIVTTDGIAAGGAVPTVALLAGAGTVGSVTQQNGYDQAGNFVLTAGTASITGGSLASVTFGETLSVTPLAVQVSAGFTSGTLGLAVAAVSLAKTGFVIQGPAPASGAAYLVSYQVIRSPY